MKSNHHHQNHRPLRLSVPSLPTSRLYPPSSLSSPFPFSPSSISTPSKLRRPSSSSTYSSFLFLLFSLRSLYSLLPFIRSSPPSFSLFPFSFLVSLLSFALLSLRPSPKPSLPLSSSHLRPLLLKSTLLSLLLLLRFQSLRLCGTVATILADLSGSLLASSLSYKPQPPLPHKILGFTSLTLSLLALSNSWDRAACSPLSSSPLAADGGEPCSRVLPIILPFLSGFLSHYERASSNWGSLRQLGRRRVRSLSLALTTAILFFPALFTFIVSSSSDRETLDVSVWSLVWPLINTALFGVILNDSFTDEKPISSVRDLRTEFLVTFFSTLALELFYFPKLSLPGFLLCGFLLWISVCELGPSSSLDYPELGFSETSESLYSMVMNPVHHILSERKSRKIAAFLLINTCYMVVEFFAGFMSNSLGLISDACHMLFDCAALGVGLYASYISRLPADHRYNYGRGRIEVLSGYVNAVLLVLVGALIVLESIERLFEPQEISTNSLLVVSVGGLLVNLVGLIFFHEEHHHAHGGGTCSHSHSHAHHDHTYGHHHDHTHGHGHEEHDKEHHHAHGEGTCIDAHLNANHHERTHCHTHEDHHECGQVSHGDHNYHNDHHECCQVSHGGHNHHNLHQHDSDKEHVNCLKHGRKTDDHDHHCHGHGHDHEHDHHCHKDKHDHHGHQHGAEIHIDSTSQKAIHEDQMLDICSASSHCHSHEGHNHNHSHEGTLSPIDIADHSHNPEKSSNQEDSRKHHHIDHNMEGIFLHVLADTMGSVGVVISTLLIKYKGWLIADPACSIFISVMIIASVVPLLRNSAEILLQRVPRAHEQELKVATDDLMKIKGVLGVQKLHIWSFTNTDIVGTFHLHVCAETDKASVKKRASMLLREAGTKDITIEVECAKG